MSRIVSYKVGIIRSHKPGPCRCLSLKLETAINGAETVSMFFYEKEGPALGFLNRESGTLFVNLREVDFEPAYRIINTEKPVFAHFRVHASDNLLLSFDLSSSEEPVGEGPTDQSP